MDHSCYKCGQMIEEGKPFCSHCGAPQIRVALPAVLDAPALDNISSGETAAFALQSPAGAGGLIIPALSSSIDWPRAFRACAVAALIAALLMALGLMVPLLAVLGAGFLAVSLYRHWNPAWSVNTRAGAQLGAVCGVLFFALAAIFESVAVVVFRTGGQLRQKMLEALQQAGARSGDPQVQAAFDRLKTPEGLAAMMILGLVFLFVVSIAAGSLAGALTGAFLGRRNRP